MNSWPRKKVPMTTRATTIAMYSAKRMMATLRSDGRRLGLRSRKGTRIIRTMTKVGKATPAISGGNRESSSCKPRKYQGAFEGLGVTPGLACPSSGEIGRASCRERVEKWVGEGAVK